MKDKRPVLGKEQWLNCDHCLWGWYYDDVMGWIVCADHNDDLFYKQPSNYWINYWKSCQPKLEKIEKCLI